MEARRWDIVIPVRPKAVQSTRFGRRGCHVDKHVIEWKNKIRPYIEEQAGGPPSKLPIRVTRIRYIYQIPQKTPAAVIRFMEAGGEVPYISAGDLADNLNKGVMDVCTGIIFVDDSQIVQVDNARKLYGFEDRIELSFEELYGCMMADGTLSGFESKGDFLF